MDLSFMKPGLKGIRPVRPDFATLVAVAVARQSSSRTAQVIAGADAGPVETVSLVDLFGAERARAPIASGCFNTAVASRLTSGKSE